MFNLNPIIFKSYMKAAIYNKISHWFMIYVQQSNISANIIFSMNWSGFIYDKNVWTKLTPPW